MQHTNSVYHYIRVLLVLLVGTLNAATYECQTIKDLLEYSDSDTLVVTDVNNVLMRTAQYLGSDEWAAQELKSRMEAEGKTKREVLQALVPSWHHIRMRSNWVCCEEITPDVIRRLQQDGTHVIGLTAQFIELAYPTHEALRSLGIELQRYGVSRTDLEICGAAAAKYIEGLICAGLDNDKGETLMRLLDQIPWEPKRIVFIDDKAKNLARVEAAVTARGIDFIGLRYAAMDHLAQDYDPAIAAVQAAHFAHILPNHAAEALRR